MFQQVGKCGSNDTNGHNYDKQYPPTIEIELKLNTNKYTTGQKI